MRCFIVGTNTEICESLQSICLELNIADVSASSDTFDALDAIKRTRPDVVFVTWDLPEMSGPAFGKILRGISLGTALVFISDSDKHAIEAFEADAQGYLIYPFERKAILSCLNRLSKNKGKRQPEHDIYVNTFGHFDIYVDGIAVVFRNSRAKEMLAMMVDRRGGMITVERFVEAFWPEEPYTEKHKAIYRKALISLKKTLEEHGISHILVTSRNQKAIIASKIRCDYYDFLDGEKSAVSQYNGEYMKDYSWAETTNSKLWQMAEKREDSLLYQKY
jgi:two-component SAPR family response regulator